MRVVTVSLSLASLLNRRSLGAKPRHRRKESLPKQLLPASSRHRFVASVDSDRGSGPSGPSWLAKAQSAGNHSFRPGAGRSTDIRIECSADASGCLSGPALMRISAQLSATRAPKATIRLKSRPALAASGISPKGMGLSLSRRASLTRAEVRRSFNTATVRDESH